MVHRWGWPATLGLWACVAFRRGCWASAGCSDEARTEWEALTDNAPIPSWIAASGTLEVSTEVAEVLPGANSKHLHGVLGLLPNGSCCAISPRAFPAQGLTPEERREAHRGFSFNTLRSESIGVARHQRDVRTRGCRQKVYPCSLPRASVVMVFHNEHLVTLLRSVHSILDHSPPELLQEVILVDDASTIDPLRFERSHWERLQTELTDYVVNHLPKTRIVRLSKRRGLIVARMEGIWRASGEVIICLDSHIEATPGWLQPLLSRISEDRTRFVVPSVDGIDAEDFRYDVFGLGLVSFKWTLAQSPRERPDGVEDIANSSIMFGGLFAADREFFLHLGGYDLDMRIWGGEEVEIGFRAWLCGGGIEHVPCSHVGHVWRSLLYWQGQAYHIKQEDLLRNKLRVAEVWTDQYKDLIQLVSPPRPAAGFGDLEGRKTLRQQLQCQPFQWLLDNVATDMRIPDHHPTEVVGTLRHYPSEMCFDASSAALGQRVSLEPCYSLVNERPAPSSGLQAVVLEKSGALRFANTVGDLCVGATSENELQYQACASASRWNWLAPVKSHQGVGQMQLSAWWKKCVTATRRSMTQFVLVLQPCLTDSASDQLFLWEPTAPAGAGTHIDGETHEL